MLDPAAGDRPHTACFLDPKVPPRKGLGSAIEGHPHIRVNQSGVDEGLALQSSV